MQEVVERRSRGERKRKGMILQQLSLDMKQPAPSRILQLETVEVEFSHQLFDVGIQRWREKEDEAKE